MAFQQLPEEPYRGATIPARLHQDVEHVSVLVPGPPQLLLAGVECDGEFVEMPRVALLTAPAPERLSVARTERRAPLANRIVGNGNARLGQVFDIPEAERESVIQSNRVADDLRRESAAVIARRLASHSPTVHPRA